MQQLHSFQFVCRYRFHVFRLLLEVVGTNSQGKEKTLQWTFLLENRRCGMICPLWEKVKGQAAFRGKVVKQQFVPVSESTFQERRKTKVDTSLWNIFLCTDWVSHTFSSFIKHIFTAVSFPNNSCGFENQQQKPAGLEMWRGREGGKSWETRLIKGKKKTAVDDVGRPVALEQRLNHRSEFGQGFSGYSSSPEDDSSWLWWLWPKLYCLLLNQNSQFKLIIQKHAI